MGESTGDMELVSETKTPIAQRKREEHTYQEAERLAGTAPFQQEYGRAAPAKDPITGRYKFGEVSPSLGMPGMTQMGQYGQQYLAGQILGGPGEGGGPRFDVRDPRTGEIVRPGELNLGFAPWERPAGAVWLPNPQEAGGGREPLRQHPWQYEPSGYGRQWHPGEGPGGGGYDPWFDPTGEDSTREDPSARNGGNGNGDDTEGKDDSRFDQNIRPEYSVVPDPTMPTPDPTIPVDYNVAAETAAQSDVPTVKPGDPSFYRPAPEYAQTFDQYMAGQERDPSLGPAPTEGAGLSFVPEWERQAAESAGAISGLLQQGAAPTDVTAQDIERIAIEPTDYAGYSGPGVSEFIPIHGPGDPQTASQYLGTSIDQGEVDFGRLRDYHSRAIEPRLTAMRRAREQEENVRRQQAAQAGAWGGRREVLSDELAARYGEIESGIRGQAEERALVDARQAAEYRHQAEMAKRELEMESGIAFAGMGVETRAKEAQNRLAAEMENMRAARESGNQAAERASRERFGQAQLDYQTMLANQQATLEASRISQAGGLGSRQQQLAAAQAGADLGLMRQGMTFGTAGQLAGMGQQQYEAMLRQQQIDKQSWIDALQGGGVGLGLTQQMLPGRDVQQWQAPQSKLSQYAAIGGGLLGGALQVL